jgi:hypothetical protein
MSVTVRLREINAGGFGDDAGGGDRHSYSDPSVSQGIIRTEDSGFH